MEFIQWGMKKSALSKDPSGFYVESGLECGKMGPINKEGIIVIQLRGDSGLI